MNVKLLSKTSKLLLIYGVFLFVMLNTGLCLDCEPKKEFYICVIIIALFSILIGWLLKNKVEKYYYSLDSSYRNAYVTGKLVGGTVYASYPWNVPGLGWVN